MYLTEKQLSVLEFIREFRQRRGISPTLEEMAGHFGVAKMTVYEHVKALEEKGAVRRTKHRARSIELTDEVPMRPRLKLPLVGLVAAGAPVEAIENVEQVDLLEMLQSDGDCYMLRVKGDSMIGDGIFEGDYVIVERRNDAISGQTVVALLENGDATLKRLYKERDGYRLQPANPRMEPVFVKQLEVQGIVVGILRDCR